ncbi:MAG: trigger factor [Sulfurimonas sp. RIFOXYD12_FULL_33_39]|uniref:trigger factor n=1 Tax=unclassified Sulfurimonas TaxID=2623549 RepID=UPI0008B2B731|nr:MULTISPECIES: trigger factor [unclassified Sulfurimonas]OHE02804.1 MAG: trigger factor [Sulfurimonas sp. RIFCSPLOWO2_12_FULL_34_6]OHE09925.1 MAG: trigger factor [Sulfurimonas sp. RIFOXYD12_FULL_33_39]OHE13567.1 MAG: trigger factor [Sulfurimonas sp. RIFOXYD2_FULL_34_21]
MKIKVNKINSANAQIEAEIPKTVVDANLEKIAKGLTKTASVQGFRKGKVPVAVVKKHYGERLLQDAEAEALREVLNKGLDELKVAMSSLIGEPNISKFDKSGDKIEVTVKVAMRPDINLDNYSDMVDAFDKPAISDDEVNERLEKLADAQGKYVDLKRKRAAKEGDSAIIDFEGSIDGELFEGGAAKEFALVLGSGQFIPGFEDQVIGMKIEEEKVIKVTFPQNYGSNKLAGKDAEFKVTLHNIQEKAKVEVDDALAEKLLAGQDDKTLENLKAQVKTQLEHEALAKLYNDELKPALLETFVAKINFDLPEFVVDQEIDVSLNKKASTMSEDEIKELRENADKLEALRETFRSDAEKSVKATFIIDALATAESVKVDENEVMQTIYYEAMQMGQDPRLAYDKYKQAGYLPAIQMSMVEDKVLTQILNSKMKEA